MSDIPIPKFIEDLDDSSLRAQLAKNGVSVGPITPTTRRLFKRRLAKKLGAVAAFQPGQKVEYDNKNFDRTNPDTSKPSSPNLSTVEKARLAEKSTPRGIGEKHQFYGIFIPKTDSETSNNEPLVFESQSSALLLIKGHKNARFKVFDSFEDAKIYSRNGAVEAQTTTAVSGMTTSEDVGNKFPSLRQVDLNQLMRLIETGDLEKIRSLIWSNPKYLISSADGPVVLKPSTRYNALHIAAKANQPEICREILETIQNLEFQALIFPNVADEAVNNQRTEHLLDTYLNTPEKILYETPLHFACKLGYNDVVTELVSYSQCAIAALNKSGKTPGEITCSRSASKNNQSEILRLLGEQYYVPLLRYHDNSEHAIVGTPITTKNQPDEYSPPGLLDRRDSPLRSSLAVSALAGPMPKDVATRFQKSWTTPSKCKELAKSVRYLRRADSEKGDEQIGRQLAEKEHVGWTEYWDFLADFANFSTEEGLLKLESYLSKKHDVFSPHQKPKESMSQDITKLADILEGIHLDQRPENTNIQDLSTKDTKLSSDSDQSKSSGSRSSYETAPENFTHEATPIFLTPRTNLSQGKSPDGYERIASELSDNLEDESRLVKRLFTENFVDNLTENFGKSLSLEHQNGTKDNNLLENDESLTYRSVDKSLSDVFSSPSRSDTSLNCSVSDYSHKLGHEFFLAGTTPTKLDRDVLVAIGDTDIDVKKFPSIFNWKSAILSFSENDRRKWATPRKEQSFSFNFNQNSSVRSGLSSPFSPIPSSGRVGLLTPNRDMRRFLYKPFTPPPTAF